MPRRTSERGFTLLECEVALVVLTLGFVLLSRLLVAHEVLMREVDAWSRDEPVYYVERRVDGYERLLGHPAVLADVEPAPPDPLPGADAFAIDVLSTSHALEPPSASATVEMTEIP